MTDPGRRLDIAVIGSGISGLAAAWLLSTRHHVTLFEAEDRLGGHSHTVDAGDIPVDTGFIVYNETTYPNLTALFSHLDVPTKASDMSFAVSLDDGRLEYSGTSLGGLFAQGRNIASPRFWSMLRDLLRFYRNAPRDADIPGSVTLGDYLDAAGYGAAFRDDHLFPMAAAIWSTPTAEIARHPAASFIRFCAMHGLLKLTDRPIWRTVDGGSRSYVQRLAAGISTLALGVPIRTLLPTGRGVRIIGADGGVRDFDHAVVAAHADDALTLLGEASDDERHLLGAIGYGDNVAVLHGDDEFMPLRRKVWSSWNYLSRAAGASRQFAVTYWMNRLQGIDERRPFFVTLNPHRPPAADKVFRRMTYRHPIFTPDAMAAQERLWSLQGRRNIWFCGAYFGAGFHEDGLQAGLAVAEALGGVRRPWQVPEESGRIRLSGMAA